MADDVTVKGGLYDITFRNALAAPDDAVTGDKANIMNMALARGCWFQYEYTVQINQMMDKKVAGLDELTQMQAMYADMANWTPSQLETPANMSADLNQLFQWKAGTTLTNQASSALVPGMSSLLGPTIAWPPATVTSGGGHTPEPVGKWENLQIDDFNTNTVYALGHLYQSADGIYFRAAAIAPPPASGPTYELVQVDPKDIQLNFDNPIVASQSDIANAARQLQAAIESKTQLDQEDQLQLQDLTASLQRWFSFTTNVNERKKHDADTIAGNFH